MVRVMLAAGTAKDALKGVDVPILMGDLDAMIRSYDGKVRQGKPPEAKIIAFSSSVETVDLVSPSAVDKWATDVRLRHLGTVF